MKEHEETLSPIHDLFIQSGYKVYDSKGGLFNPHSDKLYQKKMVSEDTDDNWIKYFINIYFYQGVSLDTAEQKYGLGVAYQIETNFVVCDEDSDQNLHIQFTRPIETLDDINKVEGMIERYWQNLDGGYYDKA